MQRHHLQARPSTSVQNWRPQAGQVSSASPWNTPNANGTAGPSNMTHFQPRAMHETGFREPQCFNCGSTGHVQRFCTIGIQCYGCGKTGHLKRDCRSTMSQRGRPTWGQGRTFALRGNTPRFARPSNFSANSQEFRPQYQRRVRFDPSQNPATPTGNARPRFPQVFHQRNPTKPSSVNVIEDHPGNRQPEWDDWGPFPLSDIDETFNYPEADVEDLNF